MKKDRETQTPMPDVDAAIGPGPATPPRNTDEVALEMMKFIAITTGYGKGAGATGFTGKQTRTAEEYAEALLSLFQRCRQVVEKS